MRRRSRRPPWGAAPARAAPSQLQATGAWNDTTCCANSANECLIPPPSGLCNDQTATFNFIFGLGPNKPQLFSSKDHLTCLTYQQVQPDHWPVWGGVNDLNMGTYGPPGEYGFCNQGLCFTGAPNQVCGGHWNRGATELEVWRLA